MLKNESLQEILTDLKSPYRMNRLLQGDVGSGKTVVAAISLFATVSAGFQGALMVPTEILAEQHIESLTSMLGLLEYLRVINQFCKRKEAQGNSFKIKIGRN